MRSPVSRRRHATWWDVREGRIAVLAMPAGQTTAATVMRHHSTTDTDAMYLMLVISLASSRTQDVASSRIELALFQLRKFVTASSCADADADTLSDGLICILAGLWPNGSYGILSGSSSGRDTNFMQSPARTIIAGSYFHHSLFTRIRISTFAC